MQQFRLPTAPARHVKPRTYKRTLIDLLAGDLDFHDQDGRLASHNFHAFPAKFPPQLPEKFITALTESGGIVLDPMLGSGTTIVEAFLTGRAGLGFDIDPLALRIARVKVTPLDVPCVHRLANTMLTQAQKAARSHGDRLQADCVRRWDEETRSFVDYWFAQETQIALLALLAEIAKITDEGIRSFFEIALSASIITKSGGVSLAFDLAHTRPHRAKIVLNKEGAVLLGSDLNEAPSLRTQFLTKTLRSPFEEFTKRVQQNIKGIVPHDSSKIPPSLAFGDSQNLPLPDSTVDLIVTSPPYASNAIDYMRAHKFSLVWFGYSVSDLGERRGKYIGGEAVKDNLLEPLPPHAAGVVTAMTAVDRRKGLILHRYYAEMTRALREMFRVLKPGKAAVVVVGSSVMRGKDTETAECLAAIGRAVGFEVPHIGVRALDRNRRMLPAGTIRNLTSQIQNRMHEEYVIGFYKP